MTPHCIFDRLGGRNDGRDAPPLRIGSRAGMGIQWGLGPETAESEGVG